VSVTNKFEVAHECTDWIAWLNSLLVLYETEMQFQKGQRIDKVNFLRIYRWISAQVFVGKNKIMSQLLLDSMLSADRMFPGAGLFVPYFLFNKVSCAPARASSQFYLEETLKHAVSDEAKQIFSAVFEQAGPLSKIIIKPSYERSTVVKFRDSFKFPLKVDPQFQRIIGYQELIDLTNPIVVMIEGAPETISEIDPLLRWNHDNQRPIVLISRNYPEEISATLASNWIRGSLSVFPATYGTDIESINLAADLISVTKGELISPHFGDLISAAIMDRDKWGTVDRMEWTNSNFSFYKQISVSRHLSHLLQKLDAEENEDMADLLRQRVLSLSNDALEVWIHKDNKPVLEELDSLIKLYNGFVISGYIATPLFSIPESFARAASTTANSLREEILNIGGFLVRTNNEMVA
jgi:hypothetical protein